jgi:hypothetical protein
MRAGSSSFIKMWNTESEESKESKVIMRDKVALSFASNMRYIKDGCNSFFM